MTISVIRIGTQGDELLSVLTRRVVEEETRNVLYTGESFEWDASGTPDVVLIECAPPGPDVDAWERSLKDATRGASLVLLYSTARAWSQAGDDVRSAARRVSPHPIRFFTGGERDTRTIEADLLGALFVLRPLARDRALSDLATANEALLEWPRVLKDGTFVERPERTRIEGDYGPVATTHFLLGPPGSGKSALLATIGRDAQARGIATVAVKADAIGPEVGNDEALGAAFGVPVALSTLVLALRMGGPVLVLVDQLDAVSALLDVHTSRLDALLVFLGRVSGWSHVHVVASARPFERTYDARLRDLDGQEIDLGRLPEDGVRAALESNGLERLVPQAGQIETPWGLDLVVRHPPPTHASLTLSGMLAHYWKTSVAHEDQPDRERLALALAALISNDEVFWVDSARLLAETGLGKGVLDGLIHDGVLVELPAAPAAVGFRHQTLHAYALTRALASEGASLSEHVLEAKREGLFVRQTLISGLDALREADGAGYELEMKRLLRGVRRPHLRALLVQWLAARETHTEWERDQIRTLLATDDGGRLLGGLASSPSSIEWLAIDDAFINWMTADPVRAERLLPLFRAAAQQHRDPVRRLVGAWWAAPQYDRLADEVLSAYPKYDGADVAEVVRLLERNESLHALYRLYQKAPAPDVFKILGVVLDKKLAAAEEAARTAKAAEPGPVVAHWYRMKEVASVRWEQVCRRVMEGAWPSVEDVRLGRIRFDFLGAGSDTPSYDDVLGLLGNDWHPEEMGVLIQQDPGVFLDEVWPRVLQALAMLPDRGGVERIEYEPRYTITRPYYEDARRIVDLLLVATGAMAESHPARFEQFVHDNAEHAAHLPHALIAKGYSEGGAALASAAAAYLTGDPRRLTLGDMDDGHRFTKEAMQTVFEHGDPGERHDLERALVGFRMYPRPVPGQDPAERQKRLQYELEHRLRLLRAVPPDTRSEEVRRLVLEGERRFPGATDWDFNMSGAYAVEARVGADRLAQMPDDEIIDLFDEYDDSTEWDSPKMRRRIGPDSGGVVEQSRVFRAMLAKNLGRAGTLLPRLTSGRHDAYASAAIGALVEGKALAGEVVRWVLDFESRGFMSPGFRDRVASELGTLAGRGGLPDDGVDLLVRWLDEHEEPRPGVQTSGDERSTDIPDHSISFGVGGFGGIVPYGRGYMIGAVLDGLLNRTHPAHDRALDILESRLEPEHPGDAPREANVAVWGHALMHGLQTLNGDRVRATELFDRVFRAFPDVWHAPQIPRIVARGLGAFTPDTFVLRWTAALAASPHPYLRQVSGELLMLSRIRYNSASWSAAVRETLTAQEPAVLRGLAMAAAEGWAAEYAREDSAQVLAAAIRASPPPLPRPAGSTSRQPTVWDGVDRVLWRADSFDPLTPAAQVVLSALADRPDIAVRVVEHLVPHLDRLAGPESDRDAQRLVGQLATGLTAAAMGVGATDAGIWTIRRSVGELTSLALTLHRLGDDGLDDLREVGLTLFEHVLAIDPAATADAQRFLDEGSSSGGFAESSRRREQDAREF